MVSSEKKKVRLNLSIEISGLLLLILVSSSVAGVVVLNDNNFEKKVGQDRYAFINFYSPGSLMSPITENLDPQFEKLAENIKMANESVLIGKVDCDKNWNVCKKYEITDWPTLKWFSKRSLKPKEHEGQWKVEFLSDFVNIEAETDLKMETVPSNLVVLTDSNFDEVVLDETKNVMVVFYAPWSVFSKAVLLTSEDIATGMKNSYVVATLDVAKYRDISDKYGITRTLTLKIFPRDDKTGLFGQDAANSTVTDRELEDLPILNFVTKGNNNTGFYSVQ
ncbi:hypothetical protein MKW98_004659 [Papaver atlanticum]|uniref:Thioredoxin domain-containing protein n=1 Tax=Papaver atlanticum TaxID=357466 RepID=A0AAD4XIK9_9MAGN|nr:hypothetical protein MKW98_004659 [Papaver atlanticum]